MPDRPAARPCLLLSPANEKKLGRRSWLNIRIDSTSPHHVGSFVWGLFMTEPPVKFFIERGGLSFIFSGRGSPHVTHYQFFHLRILEADTDKDFREEKFTDYRYGGRYGEFLSWIFSMWIVY